MATKKPQVLLTLDEELLERIEDYRYENRIPARSEAIRKLLRKALNIDDKEDSWSYMP
jgi:metal-responsive CopG/Arc/MetJ family transcriptional regulator